MPERPIYQCQCPICISLADHPEKAIHQQMNILLSRLDEQQRRWYVALEAKKLGHGGIEKMSQVTGMDVATIRRGNQEWSTNLESRPVDRIRLAGGGRAGVEKNKSE